MTRKLIIAAATAALAFTVTACNTVAGAGEDLQSASDTVKDEM